MEDVLAEVEVFLCKGAADVVFLIAAELCELLELGDDRVVGAAAVRPDAEVVVDLFPAVEGEDDVVHLFVHILDLVVGQLDAVGGDGEEEVLVVELLLFSGVGDGILDNLPVHQRFAAEKVEV